MKTTRHNPVKDIRLSIMRLGYWSGRIWIDDKATHEIHNVGTYVFERQQVVREFIERHGRIVRAVFILPDDSYYR